MKIKKNDQVVITTGKDKSTRPRKVVRVLGEENKLVVEGVNTVLKHVKRGHPKSPQGGRLKREMPIDASNAMYYCANCDSGVKLAYKVKEDGSKVRVCRKCDAEAGLVTPAKTK